MNWEGIAAVSEFVGAVVVVITLIYLARQIHQVNAQGQASARYSFIDAYGQMNMAISGSKEVASLFRRGMKGLQLDEDEHYQFFALLGQFINTWSVLFDLHEDGLLPENQWTMVRKDIITMLSDNGGRAFWDQYARHGVHDAFRDAIDSALENEKPSYLMDPQPGPT